MSDITPIGTVTLYFDDTDKFVSGTFAPEAMEVNADELITRMAFVDNKATESDMKCQAELILGSWWARMNRVELADRENYEVKTETVNCTRDYKTGSVRTWAIKFTLVKKQTNEK